MYIIWIYHNDDIRCCIRIKNRIKNKIYVKYHYEVIYVLYKKDITIQIAITTILLFLIMIFSFYNLTRSARTIEDNIDRIEKNLVLENWNAIQNDLKDIDRKWRQNELILRIVNTTESIDRFEENLSQATILTKHKEDDLIDYIAPLRDTTRVITRIIPNP